MAVLAGLGAPVLELEFSSGSGGSGAVAIAGECGRWLTRGVRQHGRVSLLRRPCSRQGVICHALLSNWG